jgi:hypothetical protein
MILRLIEGTLAGAALGLFVSFASQGEWTLALVAALVLVAQTISWGIEVKMARLRERRRWH